MSGVGDFFKNNVPVVGGLVGGIINSVGQGRQNRKQREWNERMYNKQRRDALADWNMQNAYNSPEAQMQRLKAAGLNPNLVYGNGANATMGAPVRSTDMKSWNPDALRYGDAVTNAAGNYMTVKMQEAQIDNLKAQNNVIVEDAALRKAQTIATLTGNEGSQFDLGLKRELRDVSADAARTSLQKLKQDMRIDLDSNERQKLLTSNTLKLGVEQVLNYRLDRDVKRQLTPKQIEQINAQLRLMGLDSELKQLDINLKKLGIQPSDALWQRAAGQVIDKIWDSDFMKNVRDGFRFWSDSDYREKMGKKYEDFSLDSWRSVKNK